MLMDRLALIRRIVRLMWLDPNHLGTNFATTKLPIRGRLDQSVMLYTSETLFIDDLALASAANQWIIVVLFGAEMSTKVSQFNQVYCILVVDAVAANSTNRVDHGKIMLVFEDADSMLIKLDESTSKFERHMTHSMDRVLDAFAHKEVSMRNLQHATGSWIWHHAFRSAWDILLKRFH